MANLERRNLPKKVADAPKVIKTTEKPRMKKIELSPTLFKILLFSSLSFISSTETPEINERYPGIRGKTQGEKKDMIPAKNAAKSDTSPVILSLHN